MVETRADESRRVARSRRPDRRTRPLLPRRRAARSQCERGQARRGLSRCAGKQHLPRLRGRTDDIPGAIAALAGRRDRRRDTHPRGACHVRAPDRHVARGARGNLHDDEARAVSDTLRLTMAQALVRYLAALRVETADGPAPLFAGVFAIFGHGNVAGVGEALYRHRGELPTYRAHNEQAMAHAAIAYAKANMRRRMMACTTSIGPGATNMVTAAALAHVNRLPVLLLPGEVFASRAPDPVLQQVEDFHDGNVSANDCFKPVSRYFDRIIRPEQLLSALPRAIHVLTDAALCGPVTLALPQDVQTMAHDYPAEFFAPQTVRFTAPPPMQHELDAAATLLRACKRPLIVAGGGVLYGLATEALRAFVDTHGVPVAETQAGKGALPWDHPMQAGSIGVTGSPAANSLARAADVVLAVGTRLQDFTTGSRSMFGNARLINLN